jgi:aspartokinase
MENAIWFGLGIVLGALWTWFILRQREIPWTGVVGAMGKVTDELIDVMARREAAHAQREKYLTHAVLTNKALKQGARVVMPQAQEEQLFDDVPDAPIVNKRRVDASQV